jgi:hypothetical protein
MALRLRSSRSPRTGLLPYRWIRDGVVVVAVIGLPPSRLNRLLWRLSRGQAVTPAADQIAAPRLEQCLTHLEVVLRLEKLHQGSLHFAIAEVAGDVDFLLGERVDAGVVHARRDVEGHPHKATHPTILFEPSRHPVLRTRKAC